MFCYCGAATKSRRRIGEAASDRKDDRQLFPPIAFGVFGRDGVLVAMPGLALSVVMVMPMVVTVMELVTVMIVRMILAVDMRPRAPVIAPLISIEPDQLA